jgi:hypothetical protein
VITSMTNIGHRAGLRNAAGGGGDHGIGGAGAAGYPVGSDAGGSPGGGISGMQRCYR